MEAGNIGLITMELDSNKNALIIDTQSVDSCGAEEWFTKKAGFDGDNFVMDLEFSRDGCEMAIHGKQGKQPPEKVRIVIGRMENGAPHTASPENFIINNCKESQIYDDVFM